MAGRTTPWKEGKIISIETRKGVFVLAQMLKSPYLRFYNSFRDDEKWGKIDTSNLETLFVKGITRKSFLKLSNVSVQKEATPDLSRIDSDIWISGFPGHRKTKIWENTEDEKEFVILGSEAGGRLVERDLNKGGIYDHPSGIFDRILIENIPFDDDETIDNHETMSLGVFPLTNERLYQCYKAGKNVDPSKDLMFNRQIPKEYAIAIEIISGGGSKENKEKILDTYFK